MTIIMMIIIKTIMMIFNNNYVSIPDSTCASSVCPGVMRKMGEEEVPLAICLSWTDGGVDQLDSNMFILQENDTGEIMVRGLLRS